MQRCNRAFDFAAQRSFLYIDVTPHPFSPTAVNAKYQRRHEQELLLLEQRQRGGERHSGAPMLRRYAATSASLQSMAILSAVQPLLQGR